MKKWAMGWPAAGLVVLGIAAWARPEPGVSRVPHRRAGFEMPRVESEIRPVLDPAAAESDSVTASPARAEAKSESLMDWMLHLPPAELRALLSGDEFDAAVERVLSDLAGRIERGEARAEEMDRFLDVLNERISECERG